MYLDKDKCLAASEICALKYGYFCLFLFVCFFPQLFPGRQPVVKLLETLQEWLVSLPLDKIPYDAILDLVNNKMRVSC